MAPLELMMGTTARGSRSSAAASPLSTARIMTAAPLVRMEPTNRPTGTEVRTRSGCAGPSGAGTAGEPRVSASSCVRTLSASLAVR